MESVRLEGKRHFRISIEDKMLSEALLLFERNVDIPTLSGWRGGGEGGPRSGHLWGSSSCPGAQAAEEAVGLLCVCPDLGARARFFSVLPSLVLFPKQPIHSLLFQPDRTLLCLEP